MELQHSFDAYNKSELLEEEIECYRERYGFYPERVLADKIYRNRDNIIFCTTNGIKLSGSALGRPKKDAVVDKNLEYAAICERVEVERKFSLAKRKFGMGLIRTYLQEISKTVIALSNLALNLNKVFLRIFFDYVLVYFQVVFSTHYRENTALVQ